MCETVFSLHPDTPQTAKLKKQIVLRAARDEILRPAKIGFSRRLLLLPLPSAGLARPPAASVSNGPSGCSALFPATLLFPATTRPAHRLGCPCLALSPAQAGSSPAPSVC